MKVEFYTVACQLYTVPTIKVTHTRKLDGYFSIELVFLKWGLSLMY